MSLTFFIFNFKNSEYSLDAVVKYNKRSVLKSIIKPFREKNHLLILKELYLIPSINALIIPKVSVFYREI